ncbi:MAG: hypothetical protein WCI67_22495 [Chloroflexales bacterium]
MMKVLGRTLAILFAALLVSGAAYALGSAGLAGGAASGPPGSAVARDGGPPAGFQAGEGHRPGGDREGGGGVFGALEVGKNLAIMAIIVALVAGGAALARRIWPGPRGQEPPAASAG